MAKRSLYQLRIPTERYLKLYLNSITKIEPEYVLTTRDNFGLFLWSVLERPTFNQISRKEVEKMNDVIIVGVKKSMLRYGKYELSKSGLNFIHKYLYTSFNESFYKFMDQAQQFGIQDDIAIFNFCKAKNITIDIDINFETLKKRYDRYVSINSKPIQSLVSNMYVEQDFRYAKSLNKNKIR